MNLMFDTDDTHERCIPYKDTAQGNPETHLQALTLSGPADFNLRELFKLYLRNFAILLKFIGEQDSVNFFCQGYNLLPWQPDFQRSV